MKGEGARGESTLIVTWWRVSRRDYWDVARKLCKKCAANSGCLSLGTSSRVGHLAELV